MNYDREIPIEALRYCQKINKDLHFDSMAYDILFSKGQMVISEMSYSYLASALYNAPGHYKFDPDIQYIEGHVWPQELWVRVLFEKLGLKNNAC